MNKTLVFILLTFGLLATASAFSKTPVLDKSLYFRDWGRTLYDIFRTKDATISFSSDHITFHEVDPTYRVLGFSPSSVTEILRNISRNCDTDAYVYSRLAYYEKNDSLLYFCFNNKSLLVLDSQRYIVQKSIPLTFDFPHLEAAKLYLENNSLVILLIKTIKNPQDWFNHTVFIRVDLNSQQVTQNFVLKNGFGPQESVVAYAGNGTNSYILTNVFDTFEFFNKTTTLYSFNTSGNNYTVSTLYNETYNFSKLTWGDVLSQLYVADDLVITNNNDSVLFFNAQGQLLSKAENLTFYYPDFGGWRRTPSFFEGGNKVFYYESNGTITQFTVQGTFVKTKFVVNGTQLQVGRGNSQQGDQLFYLDVEKYWIVLDLDTARVLSQVPQEYSNIFTSDRSYGVLSGKNLSVFHWSNDTLIGKIQIETNNPDPTRFYYYDAENSFFYYLRSPGIYQCDLVQIDIRNAFPRIVQSYTGDLCKGRISQVAPYSLDHVIEYKGGYFTHTMRFGRVDFPYTFGVLQQGIAAFNFDDLSFHLIHYYLPALSWNHSIFTFDSTSGSFTEQNSTKITGLDPEGVFVWNYLGGPKVFSVWAATFYAIDLSTNVVTAQNFHKRNLIPTRLFGDSEEDEGFILTDKDGVAMGRPLYYNSTTNQLGSLPTEQAKTIDARATGNCHYYQTSGYLDSGKSEAVVDFYNFCGASSEKVPFLKKFLRRYVV